MSTLRPWQVCTFKIPHTDNNNNNSIKNNTRNNRCRTRGDYVFHTLVNRIVLFIIIIILFVHVGFAASRFGEKIPYASRKLRGHESNEIRHIIFCLHARSPQPVVRRRLCRARLGEAITGVSCTRTRESNVEE